MQTQTLLMPAETMTRIAHVAGNFQTQLGIAGNWIVDAAESRMNHIGNGLHILRVSLTPGSYEYKVALNGSWHENYGAGGEPGGYNISFRLDAPKEVTFMFHDDAASKRVAEWYEDIADSNVAHATWAELDANYVYDGDDLGAVYANGQAVMKLWAPKADAVTVRFYDKDNAERLIGSLAMTRGDRGVWSVKAMPEALNIADVRGYYYQYEVTHGKTTQSVLDPYAKSMAEFRVSPAGYPLGEDRDIVGKAAIIDLESTNPEGEFGFARIEGYERREDAVIYEAHVRDFTSDPSIAGELRARWGSFRAMIDKLDYIRSLGVTHVQLLPVMAWYYGDEAAMGDRELEYSTENNQYNWGYDPHSYFSPDGAYSENARDPELRVRELKELIAAIHSAGMGVILDVVYTHMAKAWLLEDIVPGYYFYRNEAGELLGGFGSNLATNHKMAEKLMIDSVKYWFEEYKIDGMRFDMMGDATYESVQRAYDAAAAIHPNPLFIGEGWRTFSGHLGEPELTGKGADQDWMDKTDDVGVFSDEFRNELKSGYGFEGESRFLTGGARHIATLFQNIKAQPHNTPADSPGDMVQYLEAHDNLTLHDVIALTLRADPNDPAHASDIHRRIRLGHVLLLTAQGTAFLHAGQEYGRTKQWRGGGTPAHAHPFYYGHGEFAGYFVHNSYNSSDAINRFDWSKATDDGTLYPESQRTRAYTAGLIQLRKSTNAFRLGDRDAVNRLVTMIQAPEIGELDLVIAYRCQSTDGTGAYYVFVNADSWPRTLTLNEDLTGGDVLVDSGEAGTTEVAERSGFALTPGAIEMEPLTAVVIRVKQPGEHEAG
ncbi:pullulanase X25 domain-containing protein [Paenibacillus soyae]|uniref:Alpha-amylase family glycosyl hydrolase n=1 Tax=Paenibacillus soyae TaxID=2969249 RepID=A0A9X2MSG2_9BACL|nr:alpha-amylase family glycosyl hydrolase [Paenibacillus soyae]MCR2806004.1 alpha-amylase family glycosyl hydrolase [Paenibacillus soyae]